MTERPRRDGAEFFSDDDEPWYVDLLLWATHLVRPLYRALGVDFVTLQHLLRVRFLLDHRRRGNHGSYGTLRQYGFLAVLLTHLMLGIGFGVGAFFVESSMLYLTLLASAALLFLVLIVLIDFSVVLLDTTEIKLLAPLPVADRTVVAARITQISLYVAALLAAFGGVPLLLGSFAFDSPLFAGVLFLTLIQTAALALSIVLVLYLVALKSLDLSRFRDALVYLQMGAVALCYGTTQLSPLIVERTNLGAWLDRYPLVFCAWPPAAGGALFRALTEGGGTTDFTIAGAGAAVTLLLVISAAFLARRGFMGRLAALEAGGGSPRTRGRRGGITGRLGNRLAGGVLERAGWHFFVQLSASERVFRMRTLPMLAIAFFAIFGIGARHFDDLEAVRGLLPFAPYGVFFLVFAIWPGARFSDTPDAAHVLDILSGEERKRFLRGALRACHLRFLVVPLLVISLCAACFTEPVHLPGLLLATGVVGTANTFTLVRFSGFLPFTEKLAPGADSNVLVMFAGFLGTFLFAGAQWGLARIPFAVPAFTLFACVAVLLSWKRLGRVEVQTRGRFDDEPY